MEKIPKKTIALEGATPLSVKKYFELERKVSSRTYSALPDEREVRAEMEKSSVYLIKRENEVLGSISYEMKPDGTVYLSGLAIDPEHQGKGIGREAMERILIELKDTPSIELLVHPDNHKAIRLYESLGFTITGRKENHFGDGEPRMVLTRDRRENR